ncbi:hypothetical protein HK101_007543 [Irineochytrium annulatum]|nr:hypothetical protein HK101_007543 [Irineochytrium annulatum]
MQFSNTVLRKELCPSQTNIKLTIFIPEFSADSVKRMPPKRQVVAAMERKAANEEVKGKKAAAKAEEEEQEKWSKGAKVDKKEEELRKKQEAAAKKAERDALLAAEESALPSKPLATKGSSKTAAKKTAAVESYASDSRSGLESFAASGIENAIDLLEVSSKDTSHMAGAPASKGGVEKHPEKRMKSAWAAFEEREMPLLKEENPNLRLSQLKQMLQKKWKKSPENPMNQANIAAYDATRDEIRDQIQQKKDDVLESMRIK